MSVADRLNKLSTDITNAYTSINNKGGTIPANKNTDNLHTAIDSIEVIEPQTAEGESLNLTNTKAMPYNDYVVKGKSEQETRSGKNLYNIFDINNVSGLTVNNDGWATATINNSSGASLVILNLKVPTTNLINVSTNYALFLEIETVSGQGFLCLNEPSVKSQFQTDRTLFLSTLTANSVNKYIMTTRNNFESSTNMFWSYLYAEAGKSCSIKYRLSVLADTSITTDDFVYEPYGASPSPDYPSEIHSVADDDINIFNAEKIESSIIKVRDNGKTIIMPLITSGNGNTNTATKLNVLCPDLQVGDVIYIRFKRNLNNNRNKFIYLYGSNRLLNASENSPSYTITQEDLNSYVFLYGNDYDYGETEQCIITDFKIQKNTVPINYSPYNQGTVTIKQRGTTESNDYTIQTEPLRSLPNGVKDTIEEDGIHRRVGRIVLDGSENGWYQQDNTSYSEDYLRFTIGITDKKNASNPNSKKDNILSNNFTNKILDNNSTRKTNSITGQYQTNLINIFVAQNIINGSKVEDFKTWLSNNPTEVLYELEEEIIEPLTQNQATTMLDIIKTGSYEGTTNIYTDEDVKPTMKVGYYKKG